MLRSSCFNTSTASTLRVTSFVQTSPFHKNLSQSVRYASSFHLRTLALPLLPSTTLATALSQQRIASLRPTLAAVACPLLMQVRSIGAKSARNKTYKWIGTHKEPLDEEQRLRRLRKHKPFVLGKYSHCVISVIDSVTLFGMNFTSIVIILLRINNKDATM